MPHQAAADTKSAMEASAMKLDGMPECAIPKLMHTGDDSHREDIIERVKDRVSQRNFGVWLRDSAPLHLAQNSPFVRCLLQEKCLHLS